MGRTHLNKIGALATALIFSANLLLNQSWAMGLPAPAQLVNLSQSYSLPTLRGLKINPKNPLNMEFIIDPGTDGKVDQEKASLLIKYFLAALTIPQENLWVNLSTYEQDRIIPPSLSQTDLGADMLAQDYILKQVAASITYPESEIGKKYWDKLNNIPFGDNSAKTSPRADALTRSSFIKIWITAKKAKVYEGNNTVIIVDSKLTAMMDQDYLATSASLRGSAATKQSQPGIATPSARNDQNAIFKQTILPQIEKDINQGKNFANLRQVYNAIVLGIWFKNKFKESFYKSYLNKDNVKGIDTADKQAKDKIYNLYVEAFTKGVYNYVKKDYNPYAHKITRRQYYSGGGDFTTTQVETTTDKTQVTPGTATEANVTFNPNWPIIAARKAPFVVRHQKPSKNPPTKLVKNVKYGKTSPGVKPRIAQLEKLLIALIALKRTCPSYAPASRDMENLCQEMIEKGDPQELHLAKFVLYYRENYGRYPSPLQVETIVRIHNLPGGWRPLTPEEIAQGAQEGSIIKKGERRLTVRRVYTDELAVTTCTKEQKEKKRNALKNSLLFTGGDDKESNQIKDFMRMGFVGRGESENAAKEACFKTIGPKTLEKIGPIAERVGYKALLAVAEKIKKADILPYHFFTALAKTEQLILNGRDLTRISDYLTAIGKFWMGLGWENNGPVPHYYGTEILSEIADHAPFKDENELIAFAHRKFKDRVIQNELIPQLQPRPRLANLLFERATKALAGRDTKKKIKAVNLLVKLGDARARDTLLKELEKVAGELFFNGHGIELPEEQRILQNKLRASLEHFGEESSWLAARITEIKMNACIQALRTDRNDLSNEGNLAGLIAETIKLAEADDRARETFIAYAAAVKDEAAEGNGQIDKLSKTIALRVQETAQTMQLPNASANNNVDGGLTWKTTGIEKYGNGNFYFENIPDLKSINSMGFVINAITPNKTIGQFLN